MYARVLALSLAAACALGPAAGEAGAQAGDPPATPGRPVSPLDSTKLRIGRDTVTIIYSRPSARGRAIYGGLVPFDKVWRTGANAATVLRTSGKLRFGNIRLEPGSYSLFTVPREQAGAARCAPGALAATTSDDTFGGETANPWTLIVNQQTGMNGLNFDASQNVAEIPMRACRLSGPEETLELRLQRNGASGGQLQIRWETLVTWVEFRFEK